MSGTMYSGGEIWTTGFYAGATGTDAPAPTDAMAEMIADEWETFFTAAGNLISHQWKTATIKVTPISAAEVIDIPGIRSFSYASAIAGPDPSGGFPPQCSAVATLVAGSGIGNGGKGRMFLPGVAGTIDNTGRMATTTAVSLASGLATFFASVGASIDNPGQPINAAKTAPITGFLAQNRILTAVRVGNVFDTQRRRRNALAETYSSDTI